MEKYKVERFPVGDLGTNCYLLMDCATKDAAVIDPGDEAQRVKDAADQWGARIVMIINTHAHWDHIGNNVAMQQLTGAPILIHEADAGCLQDSLYNLAERFGGDGDGGEAARLLHDGDTIELGELTLTVLHTPGHTRGGICLVCEDLLFSGDTLFRCSIGRSCFPGGNQEQLLRSLDEKLRPLPGNLQVLPGHSMQSQLDFEFANNPFFNRAEKK